MDLPSRGGRAPGSQANGSFPKGTGRLSEKSPAGYPPPHHRDDTPGSAGVPPACCPFGCRSVSLRCCSRPPCRREPHGPGRSGGRAPLPVDSGGGDGRSCGRICAGGTPALPGGASSHDRVTPTGQKCRSILAPVVVEGGPSVLVTETKPVSLSFDPPRRGGRGPDLSETTEKRQKKKELSTKGHEERRRATKALRLTATGYQGHDGIVDF